QEHGIIGGRRVVRLAYHQPRLSRATRRLLRDNLPADLGIPADILRDNAELIGTIFNTCAPGVDTPGIARSRFRSSRGGIANILAGPTAGAIRIGGRGRWADQAKGIDITIQTSCEDLAIRDT